MSAHLQAAKDSLAQMLYDRCRAEAALSRAEDAAAQLALIREFLTLVKVALWQANLIQTPPPGEKL